MAISLWTSPGKLLAPVFWLKAGQAKGQAEPGLHPEPLRQWAQRAVPGRSLLSGDQGMESWQGTLCTGQIPAEESFWKVPLKLTSDSGQETERNLGFIWIDCSVSTRTVSPTCTQEMGAPGGEVNGGSGLGPGMPISKSWDLSTI